MTVVHGSLAEGDVVLRDGSTVQVRETIPEDEPALVAFYLNLSEGSRYKRFMSAWSRFEMLAETAATQHDATRLDLIATTGEKIVAHAMYVLTGPSKAEVAFAVDDALHGKGLGTLMLGQLADAATAAGIETFEAITLPSNREMVGVFRSSGFDPDIELTPDEIEIAFATSMSTRAIARFDDRDMTAAAAAVRSILHPRSIALIGASRKPGSIGAALLHNLINCGSTGDIYR